MINGVLGGESKLPPSLSQEEEDRLLKSLNEPHTREILITHNLRLVVYISKKFKNTGISMEELFSIGCIGLIKAIDTFLPEKKCKLCTYISKCINNEILMYLRKLKKQQTCYSLEQTVSTDEEGHSLLLKDIIPDKQANQDFYTNENIELICNVLNFVLNCLSYKESFILLYSLAKIKQKEIGDKIHLSQSYISRIRKKLNIKLNNFLVAPKIPQNADFIFDIENMYSCSIKLCKKRFPNFSKDFKDLSFDLELGNNYKDYIEIKMPLCEDTFIFIAELIKS